MGRVVACSLMHHTWKEVGRSGGKEMEGLPRCRQGDGPPADADDHVPAGAGDLLPDLLLPVMTPSWCCCGRPTQPAAARTIPQVLGSRSIAGGGISLHRKNGGREEGRRCVGCLLGCCCRLCSDDYLPDMNGSELPRLPAATCPSTGVAKTRP